MTFALALKQHRTDANLSQTDLAARAGVAQTMISACENGRTTPSDRVFCAIADALDLDEDSRVALLRLRVQDAAENRPESVSSSTGG